MFALALVLPHTPAALMLERKVTLADSGSLASSSMSPVCSCRKQRVDGTLGRRSCGWPARPSTSTPPVAAVADAHSCDSCATASWLVGVPAWPDHSDGE